MYTDREMTLDALDLTKLSAVEFTKAATETSNPEIRQTLFQIRSQCEQAQQLIAQYAQSKNYYMPAPPANQQDISSIAQFLQQSLSQPTVV
jgi:spore coat protein CotF